MGVLVFWQKKPAPTKLRGGNYRLKSRKVKDNGLTRLNLTCPENANDRY